MVVAGTEVGGTEEAAEALVVTTVVVVTTEVLAGQLVTDEPQEVMVMSEVMVVVTVTGVGVGATVGAGVTQVGRAVTKAGLLETYGPQIPRR